MYTRQICIAGDSYQLSYEHPKQLDCARLFRTPAETSPFKLPSGKHQMLESLSGTELVENGKRSLCHYYGEGVSKRARQDNAIEGCDETLLVSILREGTFSEEVEWWASSAVGYKDDSRNFEAGDFHFTFSEQSHWRRVLVGAEHQADLPQWTCLEPEINADKRCGTCVVRMPDFDSKDIELQIHHLSKICHDCAVDRPSSIRCTRRHVMAAREKLSRELGLKTFIQLGISDMGEAVAEGWSEEDESLFHEVVLSNPSSSGRNFWNILADTFPCRHFKELVSYYFNVFMLRKRAHQNRFDHLNVDSDYDSDVGFTHFGEGEEGENPADLTALDRIDNGVADEHLPVVGKDHEERHNSLVYE